jgi:hypothetical protein
LEKKGKEKMMTMTNSTAVRTNEGPILQQLDELIKRRNDTPSPWPEKSADSTSDWLAINFLFNIGCQDLGSQGLNQLNVIFRGWTSPNPLSLREFGSMLQTLRELIAQGV